jgi:CRISPR/Cas system CSM-associated protein Csm3 (group 7 of RAMP superfamily)
MNTVNTHRFIIRASIEFTTPFHIGSGFGDDIADATFVADANGLPTIPGSSLAGVLRSAFRSIYNDPIAENKLFGFQQGNMGQGSRLAFSWACIHDQHDIPVEGIADTLRLADPVLSSTRNPVLRDHVRINHKGASDNEEFGKFDEQAVCAGHRFTFEAELTGNRDDRETWNQFLSALCDPSLRLGGKSRRGFGAFKIIKSKGRGFDLSLDSDFSLYREHPVSLAQASPALDDIQLPITTIARPLEIPLHIKPTSYWMFGGGTDLPDNLQEADLVPIRDCRISWRSGQGNVEKDLLIIPASSLKGALSHRIAFHYNALTGVFADKIAHLDETTGENNVAVQELFGYSKGHKNASEKFENGRRGKIILDDIYLSTSPASQHIHHVGIDRFTGGARDQVLFSERPLWQGEDLAFSLFITDPKSIKNNIKYALWLALNDLVNGRLQIGAGSGRGEGFFNGKADWPPDASDWLPDNHIPAS